MKLRTLLATAVLFVSACALATPSKWVKIYFFYTSGLNQPETNTFDLKPVRRSRATSRPDEAALRALLAGPNAPERTAGLASPDAQRLTLQRVTHNRRSWNAYFRSQKNHGWAGDMSPGRFKMAVQWTLRQFAGRHAVVVFIDGKSDFDQMGG